MIIRKTVTDADLETILVGRLVKRDPGDGVVKLFHLCQLGNILQLLFNFGLSDRFELKKRQAIFVKSKLTIIGDGNKIQG